MGVPIGSQIPGAVVRLGDHRLNSGRLREVKRIDRRQSAKWDPKSIPECSGYHNYFILKIMTWDTR